MESPPPTTGLLSEAVDAVDVELDPHEPDDALNHALKPLPESQETENSQEPHLPFSSTIDKAVPGNRSPRIFSRPQEIPEAFDPAASFTFQKPAKPGQFARPIPRNLTQPAETQQTRTSPIQTRPYAAVSEDVHVVNPQTVPPEPSPYKSHPTADGRDEAHNNQVRTRHPSQLPMFEVGSQLEQHNNTESDSAQPELMPTRRAVCPFQEYNPPQRPNRIPEESNTGMQSRQPENGGSSYASSDSMPPPRRNPPFQEYQPRQQSTLAPNARNDAPLQQAGSTASRSAQPELKGSPRTSFPFPSVQPRQQPYVENNDFVQVAAQNISYFPRSLARSKPHADCPAAKVYASVESQPLHHDQNISPPKQPSLKQSRQDARSYDRHMSTGLQSDPAHQMQDLASPTANEVSAVSEHRPDRLSHRRSSRPEGMVNRPVRNNPTPSRFATPGEPPFSSNSTNAPNSSRRRMQPQPHGSSRYHPSSPILSRISRRGGRTSRASSSAGRRTPATPVTLRIAAKFAAFVNTDVARELQSVEERHTCDVHSLQDHVEKQKHTLSKYKKKTRDQDMEIQKMADEREHLQEHLKTVGNEMKDSSTRVVKLEEKCRVYKDHLNSAIAEHQGLYKQFNARCEEATKKMQIEEQKRQSLVEQERKQAEATRERLYQIVKSTVADCKRQERESQEKIVSLKQQAKDRDADIIREKETVQTLLQQTASITSVEETLKSLGSQTQEIVNKLSDCQSRQTQREESMAEKYQTKLDEISERLGSLADLVQPQPEAMEKLHAVNAETVASLIGKLEAVLELEAETKQSVFNLAGNLREALNDIWEHVEDQDDSLDFRLHETLTENALLLQSAQEKNNECNALARRLSETAELVQQREQHIYQMRAEIDALKEAQNADEEVAQRSKALEVECSKLNEELATKSGLMTELENKLRESKQANLAEKQKHEDNTLELNRQLQEHEVAAQLAKEKAIEAARRELTLDMDKAKAEIQNLVGQAEHDRTSLRQQLETEQHKVSVMEKDIIQDSATISELKSRLETTQAKNVQLTENAEKEATEHKESGERNSSLIAKLEGELADAENKLAQLQNDAQNYEEMAQNVLDGLKQWAQDHEVIDDFASEIEKHDVGNIESMDPRLRKITEIDALHKAIYKYCRTQKDEMEAVRELESHTKANGATGTRDNRQQAPSSSDSPLSSPPSSLQRLETEDLWDRFRRVTVKSPMDGQAIPVPPTVEQEKAQRREHSQPKGIMKRITRSTSKRQEQGEETGAETAYKPPGPIRPGSGIFSRSLYNRPVAGSTSRTHIANAVQHRSTTTNATRKNVKLEDEADDETTASAPLRRARSTPTPFSQEASRKRANPGSAKENPSVAAQPSSPVPEQGSSDEIDLAAVPGAPRKRRRTDSAFGDVPKLGSQPVRTQSSSISRRLPTVPKRPSEPKTYGSKNRDGSSQETSQEASPGSRQNAAQNPLELFYRRRASRRPVRESQGESQGESQPESQRESQNSMAHSQDAAWDETKKFALQQGRFFSRIR